MKKNLTFLLTLVIFLGLAGSAFAVVLTNPLGSGDFKTLICKIVGYVSGLVAALSVLMFVIAGIFYVTSAGDPSKIGRAKQILIYAIIGTAIALAAYGLIELIATIIGANGGAGCGGG